MSGSRLAAILGAVALAAIGLAIYETLSLHSTVAVLALVTRERDSLQAQLRAQKDIPRRQPFGSRGARLQAVADRAVVLRTTYAQAKGGEADQVRMVKYHRRYDRFVGQRGLSSAQADRFFEILAEWEDVSSDVQSAIRDQGLAATPAAQELRDQLQDELEVQPLMELLGQKGEQAYMVYEGNSFFEAILDPIAREMGHSNQALTDGQTDQILALIRSNMRQVKDNPTSMSSRVVFDWDIITASAGSYLSPSQITAMQTAIGHTYQHR